MRAFRSRDIHERLDQWWDALAANGSPRVPAKDLYVGPYWATVRELPDVCVNAQLDIRMWVASAGYGLVPAEASIRPYSATFRRGVADAVLRDSDLERGAQTKQWWAALGRHSAIGWRAPRRIGALAKRDPRARIVVLGSPSYLAAMEDDLGEVLRVHRSGDRLVIVSSDSARLRPELQQSCVESTGKLLARVGGSLPALHARVARQILLEAPRFGLNATELRARWAGISDRSPDAMKPVRAQATDEEVKSFIRDSLKSEPSLKHTKLLRDFRTAGRACEQSRFKSLFLQVAEERR
jgi:hypothetical protein